MEKDKNNHTDDIRIEQINPRNKLNKEEKRAIAEFEMERDDELLSKTMQFKALNSKCKNEEFELPKAKEDKKKKEDIEDFALPKKKISLTQTIKLKINEIRESIEESSPSPQSKQKKSLYDTVAFKLDALIKSKKSLNVYRPNKVTKIEDLRENHFRKTLKNSSKKINVNSEEFGRELYNLNKIALTKLSKDNHSKSRKYVGTSRLNRIEKIHISKENYLQYQKKLSKFAINKLYYKLAPKETNKYKLYRASVYISSIVFLITGIIIINWFIQGISINKMSYSLQKETVIETVEDGTLLEPVENVEDLKTEEEKNLYWKYVNTPLSSVDFTELLSQNKDTVGWLIVNNTNINYPVVQTTNNDYYLKHAFDRSNNNAGWVFADFRNNFNDFNRNLVIYAHGRKDRVMFGSLIDTLNEEWYKNPDNQIIQLSTIKYDTMWQIISIYKIRSESYYITTDFSSDTSYETFLNVIKERSIYDFNVNVTKDDKILTLSTCYNDNGIRLVIQAKLVKMQQK